MSDKTIDPFLADTIWGEGTRKLLAGDASNRRYERIHLSDPDRTAVLMIAPRAKGEDTAPFVTIAEFLTNAGLKAPEILKWNEADGLVLLEDLGDDLFARVLSDAPQKEEELYRAAVDVLLHLRNAPPPADLLPYDAKTMAPLGALALDWYAAGGDRTATDIQKLAFSAELETVLVQTEEEERVLVQRDYHAENLLWLPTAEGVGRVGLLDFQDARAGQSAYDLASLLEDARRDVSSAVQEQMIAYYIAQTGKDEAAFRACYAAQAAQRNLRILGVFARLSMHFGKPSYVDLIPRVWDHLQRDLSHPNLGKLRDMCESLLPPPTPEILQKLRDKCATIPTL